jgi:tetratricopeptide (TPR) repeat protein
MTKPVADQHDNDGELDLREALASDEQLLGPESYEVALRAHELANVLASRGELSEAVALYERALEIKRQVLGPRHPELAATLHNLAVLHESAGSPDEARSLWAEGLAVVATDAENSLDAPCERA